VKKDDWIWVVVKGFGIYFLLWAIGGFAGLLGNGAGLLLVHFFAKDSGSLADMTVDQTIRSMGIYIMQFLLFTAGGLYFLLSGKLIFRLIAKGETRAKAWLTPQNPEPPGPAPEQLA
jgi:hypothetical protein